MKKRFAVLVTGILMVGMVGLANAVPLTITNGGFETGDFTGWTFTGTGARNVTTSDSGYNATEGNYFANLYATTLMAQGVSWAAGDTLSFDWNFNSNDYMPWNDVSIFKASNAAGDIVNITLADVKSAGNYNATGWNNYTYTFAAAGSGDLAFGVYNVGDTALASQLYVDNIHATPVPAAVWLFGSGLVGLVGLKKRRAKK